MIRRTVPVVLLLLAGCVYYNGMYNARRLADAAEKAEREGRTFDANNYWGQAAVKAESLVARHPDSEWADDALLLRGRALARMGQCAAAMPPLDAALRRLREPELIEQALYAKGRCHAEQGDTLAASAALGRLLDSRDSTFRTEARTWLARVKLHRGDYAAALALLGNSVTPGTEGDHMVALAGVGRTADAMTIADTLIARADTLAPWSDVLAALDRRDPAAAASLLDRLRGWDLLDVSARAELLVDAAQRRLAHEPDAAVSRLRQAEALAPGTAQATRAKLMHLRVRLSEAGDVADLATAVAEFQTADSTDRLPGAAVSLLRLAEQVVAVVDSAPAGAPEGDLRLFLIAELARDSLRADRVADALFWRVVEGWPGSPYAAKALLAASRLTAPRADSARTLLTTRYAASPYLAVALGRDAPEYRALEDSLAAFATGWKALHRDGAPGGRARPNPRRGRIEPVTPGRDRDPDLEPSRQRRPRRGGRTPAPL